MIEIWIETKILPTIRNLTKMRTTESMITTKDNATGITIKDGLFKLTNDEYHAHPAMNRSKLNDFLITPLHYYKLHVLKMKEEIAKSPQMILGSLVHTLVLEPEIFEKEWAVSPDYDARTTKGKEIRDNFKIKSAGKTVVESDTFEMAKKIISGMTFQQKALIENTKKEYSLFWTDPHTEIQCKCKPDAFASNYVIDIKTAKDASPKAFQRAIVEGGYHIQAGMINEAFKTLYDIHNLKFIYIVFETHTPFVTATYMLDDSAIEIGTNIFKNALLSLRESIKSDTWNGYETQTLSLPNWYGK